MGHGGEWLPADKVIRRARKGATNYVDIDAMERWNSLNTMEMSILRAMKHQIEMGHERVPIRDVAAEAYSSTASVVRLAKKLGYPGYSAMLFAMQRDEVPARDDRDAHRCTQLVSDRGSLDVIEWLPERLLDSTLARIHVVGAGYSAYVAGYFCQRLQELGLFATEKSPLDFHDGATVFSIFVSESGETSDLAFIQERCRLKGIEDCVITAHGESTLSGRARRRIVVRRRGRGEDDGADLFSAHCLIIIEHIVCAMRRTQEGKLES